MTNFDYILDLLDDLASTITGTILADITEDAVTAGTKKGIKLAKESKDKIKSLLSDKNLEGIMEIVYQLSKAGLNIIANRNADYADKLNEINNTSRKNIKEIKKRTDYLAVVCETDTGIRTLDGFRTQASNQEEIKCLPVSGSSDDKVTDTAERISNRKKLKWWYENNNHKVSDSRMNGNNTTNPEYQQDRTVKEALLNLSEKDYSSLPPTEQVLYTNILQTISDINANQGIDIIKYTVGSSSDTQMELYFPDFTPYAIATVKFSDHNEFMTGTTQNEDDKVGNKYAVTELCNKDMITPESCLDSDKTNAIKEIIHLKSEYNLEWHHNEDLDTYQLISAIVHHTARHAGAGSIINQIEGSKSNPISKTNRDSWRSLLGFPVLP